MVKPQSHEQEKCDEKKGQCYTNPTKLNRSNGLLCVLNPRHQDAGSSSMNPLEACKHPPLQGHTAWTSRAGKIGKLVKWSEARVSKRRHVARGQFSYKYGTFNPHLNPQLIKIQTCFYQVPNELADLRLRNSWFTGAFFTCNPSEKKR